MFNPTLPPMAITSTIQYQGELRTEAIHVASLEKITTDAPVDNHGKGQAFSPTDLAATSLGACAMTIMGIVAEREALDFTGSRVEVTKIMSTDTPRRIVGIDLVFHLKTNRSLDLTEQKKYEAAAHACPVAKSLHPDLVQRFTFHWA